MIKKLLSAILLFTSAGVISSYAQLCTPNVTCASVVGVDYGICPDSAAGIAAGVVNVAYNQVLSVKTPATAAHWGQPSATIDSLVVTSVDSLAPGLTYQCVPSHSFTPGTECLLISGTPTQVWNKLIIVHIDAHVKIGGFPLDAGDKPNKQYRSIVTAVAGIESLDLSKFEVEQNIPNPFGYTSQIRFSSVNASDVEFKVYNLLGAIVLNNKFKSTKGVNTINLDADQFAPGVYMYSIKNGDATITKRMVVSK
jgi:hypothetical protein